MKQVAKSEIERGLSFIVPYTLHINIKWLGYTGWKPEIYFFIFRQIKAYNCTTLKVGKKSEIKYDLPFLVLVVKSHYYLLTWSLSYWVKPKIKYLSGNQIRFVRTWVKLNGFDPDDSVGKWGRRNTNTNNNF
jgi:hypothetical protein